MKYKVFFAWQSQNKDTENYIKKELKRTKKELAKDGMDIDLIFSPTQEEAGSPDIKKSIIEQIMNSDIFIGDLSFIDNDNNVSNGNVLYESGLADAFLGEERVILVCDEKTTIEKIAFDINHKRISKIDTRMKQTQLDYWIRTALEEADRNKYVKTYAIEQFEEEVLFLLNFFYKYINMPNYRYHSLFRIPQPDEIRKVITESVFPAFILNVDFHDFIIQMEEKMIRLNQLSHKRTIWNIMNIITKLKDYNKFCWQARYSFIGIIENEQEQYNIYDIRNFFLREVKDFSNVNKTILFEENCELINGKSGTLFMDKRIFKKDDKNYKEDWIQMNNGYQRVIASRNARISDDAVNVISELIYNILMSIKQYLDYCEFNVVFETDSILTIKAK